MIVVRRNFWFVLGLLLISILAASIWGSPIYYRMIYLWVILIGTSWVWTYVSLRNIGFTRQARTLRQQVGQIFEERFEIANLSRLPRLFMVVRDSSDLPGSAGSRVLTWIGGKQIRTYLSYTWLVRRGLFELGPTVLESGDLFGLFRSQVEYTGNDSLLVTPYLVDLDNFPSPAGFLPGGRAMHIRSMDLTPYAAGVREYVPGDPLSRVHWPTTARRDRLMVKEFEQDPQADIWIIVDADAEVQAALPESPKELRGNRLWLWLNRPDEVTLPPTTMDYAVSVAASVALHFIQKGMAVGLVSAGSVYTIHQSERGERQLSKLLDTLAFLQGEGNLPLSGLVETTAGHFPRGSTVVLITPSTRPGVIAAVDDLGKRNQHPVCVLIDPVSFGGQGSGDLVNQALVDRRIPIIPITNGCDLKVALESSSANPYLRPRFMAD